MWANQHTNRSGLDCYSIVKQLSTPYVQTLDVSLPVALTHNPSEEPPSLAQVDQVPPPLQPPQSWEVLGSIPPSACTPQTPAQMESSLYGNKINKKIVKKNQYMNILVHETFIVEGMESFTFITFLWDSLCNIFASCISFSAHRRQHTFTSALHSVMSWPEV